MFLYGDHESLSLSDLPLALSLPKRVKQKRSSYPVGCTHQSSDPTGCTHQSSDPIGCNISLVIAYDAHISLMILSDAHISLVIPKNAQCEQRDFLEEVTVGLHSRLEEEPRATIEGTKKLNGLGNSLGLLDGRRRKKKSMVRTDERDDGQLGFKRDGGGLASNPMNERQGSATGFDVGTTT
ncbi:NBS-LRR type resistance protein [Cucumis melo var. makuwa]|uniref:NBS-LRR type resistance protein n=1 Tax=Cucumis melo var. makuwa TaxID=1194695 RepID=A0A5A7SMR3_CUCMM|nr:NBS-LRR type resistance protein [Cucumis melo var. makuwa]